MTVEAITTIAFVVGVIGYVLYTPKKKATRTYSSAEMVQDSDRLYYQIKNAKNELELETARLELERFRILHATCDEGVRDYDALCIVWNLQKKKLESERRYTPELSSEYIDITGTPTFFRNDKKKLG